METSSSRTDLTSRVWMIALLCLYGFARLLQLFSAHLPPLLIVIFHVIPPALFALIHGTRTYGLRAALSFFAICLGTACFFESLSLRTGFPFGHYVFTGFMGPKLFQLPILLALAYVGIGYSAWVVAVLILGHANKRLSGRAVWFIPLLASAVFFIWDIAMDADWSTVDRAWLWHDGGAYFGVPISNFLGWYLTGYIFFQLFSLYLRNCPPPAQPRLLWRLPVLLYALCALGNLLLILPVSTAAVNPAIVYDPSGHTWHTESILLAAALVSALGMGSFAALAWWKARQT